MYEDKLSPFDWEVARMVESLTEEKTRPIPEEYNYLIIVNYFKHPEPLYIDAVIKAIEGRVGNRLLDVVDCADKGYIRVRIRYGERTPKYYGEYKSEEARPEVGKVYCPRLRECRALQVREENVRALIKFVGGGEYEKEAGKPGVFHFRNAAGSVLQHARDGEYIVYQRPGLYLVMCAGAFLAEYEEK